jgi:hypothetical protein
MADLNASDLANKVNKRHWSPLLEHEGAGGQ